MDASDVVAKVTTPSLVIHRLKGRAIPFIAVLDDQTLATYRNRLADIDEFLADSIGDFDTEAKEL